MNNLPKPHSDSLTGLPPIEQPAAPVPRPGHDASSGRFLPGNTESVRNILHSLRGQDALLPGQEQLRDAIAERRIEWLTDLGGEDASFAKKDLVNRGLRCHVILD